MNFKVRAAGTLSADYSSPIGSALGFKNVSRSSRLHLPLRMGCASAVTARGAPGRAVLAR